ALEDSKALIKGMGTKALIVTGKNVTKSGAVKTLTSSLDEIGIAHTIFNDIPGEPTVPMIEEGVKAYRENACDFLIAIGGGSPLDSAKAIAAMAVLDGSIASYMGKEIEGEFPPMVLIPTTAGTGSEATKFTIITDLEKNIKMLLKGDALVPDLAILDYRFTITAPPGVTAATGMDALTHAVEAYTSRRGNPLTELYALDAIKRIFAFLPAAYKDGSDKKAREEMLLAAYEAGVCINNASVTLVHGMSRPLGANFHIPHGISNAMLIKECLTYAADGCYEKFAAIARAIGAAEESTDNITAATAFLDKLGELCGTLEIPTLREYGIDKNEFDALMDKMAHDAIASGSPGNTIKIITEDDIKTVYKKLW
ncbi:MAG: alcohol dehydrogenase, partial [Clostridiales bacterium 43-6]